METTACCNTNESAKDYIHEKQFRLHRENGGGVWLLLIKLLLQFRKAGHSRCRLHQLQEHCVGFIRYDRSFFGCPPRPVDVCLYSMHTASTYFSLFVILHRGCKKADVLCLCSVDLGGEALHTHQHSPAGQGGRPVQQCAVRGDDHSTRFTPRLREHLVRTLTPLSLLVASLLIVMIDKICRVGRLFQLSKASMPGRVWEPQV